MTVAVFSTMAIMAMVMMEMKLMAKSRWWHNEIGGKTFYIHIYFQVLLLSFYYNHPVKGETFEPKKMQMLLRQIQELWKPLC